MVAVYLLLPSAPPPPPPRTSTVVVVSLDGFRPSYLTPDVTPNLHSLANGGALAEYMLPVFPSVTFPNHYSIATGLWPIWHGIVNNVFHAPDVAEPDGNGGSTVGKFDHGPARDSRYWLGEPIWTTLEYNGVTTGSVMFPGSMAPHGPNNTVPTHLIDFDPNWSAARKVDQVVEWLSLPETRTGRPQLTMLYIGDVDATGHGYGPYAPQMNDTLRAVDKAVGDLVSRARAAVPGITFVVLSDHGMAQIEDNTTIALDDFLDLSLAEVITHSPIAFIQPRNASDTQGIYERLKNASDSGPAAGKWRVWLKEEIPDQWHYSDSGRISPIVALPVDGWTFVIKSTGEGRGKWIRGTHGFAPDHPDMRAFFAVNGPGVKAGSRISGGMRNTEVYSIVARLVGGKGYERRWRMAPTNWTQEWRDKVGEVLLDGW
ncbi:alkaline-phosphatase-like protein [Hyaloraphidium curvatum]|nr:alkaline-phosphatase-like protein [Hyaloraphidium curvatum]